MTSTALLQAMTAEPVNILVKTEGGWDVWLIKMIFNWRICLSVEGDDEFIAAGWCYFGTGLDTQVKALNAINNWHDLDDGAPEGFDKCAFDGRENVIAHATDA